MALGASRGRIVAQMFAEALVLGSVAAIVGVTAADFALRTWGTVFLETNLGRLPFWFDLGLSPRAFAVAIVLTVAAAAIAGIMPAMKITRGMGHRLKQTTAGSGGLQFGGVWNVVIVAQVVATVIFPALVYWEQSQLRRVKDFDSGFANENTSPCRSNRITGRWRPERRRRHARAQRAAGRHARRASPEGGRPARHCRRDVRRALPDHESPAEARRDGLRLDMSGAASAKSAGTRREASFAIATVAAVDPSYSRGTGRAGFAGRGFTAADAVPGTRVAIVDQGFIDQVLQGRNAIGQQVRFRYPGPPVRRWAPGNPDDPAGPGEWYKVIGVVRELGVGAPTQAGRAAGFYIPGTPDLFEQIQMMVHVRGGNPMSLAPQVRDAATAVDPSLRLVGVQRVNEANNDIRWVMGLWLRITVVLSSVALVLSLAGIYAVLSFTVARRTREIGVRVALGASRQRVLVATFRRPLLQVALGIVVGTAIVFTMASMIRYTELPGSESDLTLRAMAMIIAYGIVMLGVCLLGCVVIAAGWRRRAAVALDDGRADAGDWSVRQCGNHRQAVSYALSTALGSSRDARQAGSTQATAATRIIVAATPATVGTSVGRTPNNSAAISRFRAKAPASPRTTPIPARTSPSFITPASTLDRSAPSAMRIPISRRRSATMEETTPYVPMAARSSARPAKSPSSCARKRGRWMASAKTVSMSRRRTTGTARSISRTMRSMVCDKAAGVRVVRNTTCPSGANPNPGAGLAIC